MLRLQEFAGRDQFTFCKPTPGRSNRLDCSEDFKAWASNYSYFAKDFQLASCTCEMPRSYEDHGSQARDELTRLAKGEGHDVDVASPRLWKSASYNITRTYPVHHTKHDGKYLCHNSRKHEIAKYRKEMLDMIQEVPEFAYELSLRDLTELPRVARAGQESLAKRKQKGREKRGTKNASESEGIEHRNYLLKVFFPPPLGTRKSFGSSTVGSKASPKPKFTDKEKDNPGKNESGRSSTSIPPASRRRKMRGCYPFL